MLFLTLREEIFNPFNGERGEMTRENIRKTIKRTLTKRKRESYFNKSSRMLGIPNDNIIVSEEHSSQRNCSSFSWVIGR